MKCSQDFGKLSLSSGEVQSIQVNSEEHKPKFGKLLLEFKIFFGELLADTVEFLAKRAVLPMFAQVRGKRESR